MFRKFWKHKGRETLFVVLMIPFWFLLRYPFYDEAVWGRWGATLTLVLFVGAPVWLVYTVTKFFRENVGK
ncbi:hypothetical protein SAMN04488044_2795 [Cognatishimia maritima]|uniref:Uncharacterized protein n=1 Tax=Cognatishimia maritima TaxID=870908 RepID=A0A1M5U564_9RHOB|nr:hypothetical protein SAMN04488044_2795 [Cognatishimia maritima]